jgi:hypothetical protein
LTPEVSNRARRRFTDAASVIGIWLLSLVVFFREFVFSGFSRIQIRGGDSDIAYVVAEHWYQWLSGSADWKSPAFFFPAKGTLGYTDTQFLYLPPYAILRWMGADMFIALQFVVMLLTGIGYFSMYLLLRRHLKVRVPLAAAASVAFAFSNALTLKQFHVNTFGIEFVPLVILLAAESVAAIRSQRRTRSIAFAIGAGLLWELLFFTSFYMAWFLGLALMALAAVLLLVDRELILAAVRWLRSNPQRWMREAAGFASGFAIGIIPSLMIYLPVMSESGGRTFGEVLTLSPRPSDVFNLGRDNSLWGRITWPGTTPLEGVERSLAVSPLLVVSSIVGLVILWSLRSRVSDNRRLRVLTGLAVTAAVIALVSWRFGDWSMWKVIWKFVPGGKAIRAVDRVQFIMAFFWVIVWAGTMNEIWSRLSATKRKAGSLGIGFVILLSGFIMLEQVNLKSLNGFDHADRSRYFASMPEPPEECRSFYAIDPIGKYVGDQLQLQAMLVSVEVGLPTVNGLSGMTPPGWNLWSTSDPTYPDVVRAWAETNGIAEGLCQLDFSTKKWSVA